MLIEEYTNRIGYIGELIPNLNLLKQLQKSHLLSIPFENLDIHYGHTIELDIDKIYNKVVINGRGGFCYELNGLFNAFLTRIGFKSKMISARVYSQKSKSFGMEFDHLAIIVNLDGKEYLVDVGYGDFTFHPIRFELNSIQSDPRGDFIIEKYDDTYFQVSKVEGKSKSIEYIFTDTVRELNEFIDMCTYHQTSPKSHFTQNKLISKATEAGRVTLTTRNLKITQEGGTNGFTELKEGDFGKHLLDRFNINEEALKLI